MEMTIGKRITAGFTMIILIAIALGGLGVWNMLAAKTNSTKLASEYVPEVEIATALRNAVNQTMFAMRGYSFTEEESFFTQAEKEMGSVNEHVKEASDLAGRAVHLKTLQGQVSTAKEDASQYSALMGKTKESVTEMQSLRANLDQDAAEFMKNCYAFLADKNVDFKTTLDQRSKKVRIATEIADLGTRVRIDNFKAQALNDMSLMQRAISLLGGVKKFTGELRPMTTKVEDIALFDAIESAAAVYAEAMSRYVQIKSTTDASGAITKAASDGASKNELSLNEQRSAMDKAATAYGEQCAAYQADQITKLDQDMKILHEQITLANDIVDLGNDARLKAFKGQALRSPAIMKESLANFPKLEGKYSTLRKVASDPLDLKLIDATEAAGNNYSDALSKLLATWIKLEELGVQRNNAAQVLLKACGTTADAGMENTANLSKEAARSLSSSSTIMIVGLILGSLAGVVCAFLIIRSITGPLKRIIDGLAAGSGQVASASGQVASASQQMAEGATEQAAGLEETSSSLEEMAAMTKQSAANAQQANLLASEARKAADSGSSSMNKMSTAIHDIQQSAGQTAKIIKVIDEIAFQTNLLALNAAVEAARAGEAGKGFAVVAEEVRNLAKRSAEAAKNTASLIEESVGNAKNGVEIAAEVGETLSEIVAGISKTAVLVSEIAAASAEQSQGIDQINMAVTQMDKVTQSNAANAEESASASEELNSQAGQMNDMVAELMTMVGGITSQQTVAVASSRRPAPRVPTRSGKTMSAARSIPFDEDLNDFNK